MLLQQQSTQRLMLSSWQLRNRTRRRNSGHCSRNSYSRELLITVPVTGTRSAKKKEATASVHALPVRCGRVMSEMREECGGENFGAASSQVRGVSGCLRRKSQVLVRNFASSWRPTYFCSFWTLSRSSSRSRRDLYKHFCRHELHYILLYRHASFSLLCLSNR